MTIASRRRVLKGVIGGAAVTVGLPFLDCFLNNHGTALAASGAALPVVFGHWYQALGLNPGMWIPETTGPGYKNNVQLKVLDPYRDKINLFSGMRYFLDGRPHETHVSTPQIATTGAVFDGGKIGPSLDSKIADVIGTRTRFRSLEVSLDGSRGSWSRRSASALNPSEGSPAALYKKIFGPEFRDPNSAEFKPDPMAVARRSVLSLVSDQRNELVGQVGAADKARLDEYFTSIREIEQQLDIELQKPAPMESCIVPGAFEEARPSPDVTNIITNSKLFAKLLAHAVACGQTRVFNINVGSQGWRRPGTSYAWHSETHEEAIDPKLGYQRSVFGFLTVANQVFADFLGTLQSYKEGSGTVLDRALVLWQTDHGDARTHTIEEIPIMTAGGAGGLIKGGNHVRAAGDPCCRVGLTVQQALGVPINSWGDRSNETSRPFREIMA